MMEHSAGISPSAEQRRAARETTHEIIFIFLSSFCLFLQQTPMEKLYFMANVEDIKSHHAPKVTTCSDGTWILVICCNPFIWHIKAEKGIFKADF